MDNWEVVLDKFSKDTNSTVIFASQIGGSIYTSRKVRDIDIFTIYEQNPTTILDTDTIRHFHYEYNGQKYDVTSISLGGFLNLIKYGSFRAYDGILKGKILIPNNELTSLVQEYVNYPCLAKVCMEMYEIEYGDKKPDTYKHTGKVLQHLANIYWCLQGKYAPTKLNESFIFEPRIQEEINSFCEGKIDVLSNSALDIIYLWFKDLKEQTNKVEGYLLTDKQVITNYVRGKLNAIL